MKKSFWFVLIFIFVVTGILHVYQGDYVQNMQDGNIEMVREEQDVSLNEFLSMYKQNDYKKIVLVDETTLKGYSFLEEKEKDTVLGLSNRSTVLYQYFKVFETKKSANTSLQDLGIVANGKTIIEVEFTEKTFLQNFIAQVGPILLILLIFFLVFKFLLPKGGPGGLPFNVKSGKLNTKKQVNAKFKDVAGMEEVKLELSEIVDYLKNPQKYHKVGARHPKGVLLFGQPGSGKTLLARAVAGESSVPFFSVSGSEFMEMLVGMGAAKVRDLFNKAKTSGKAIIFIDEIDAIGRKRGMGHTGGHQEQEQTLNQILTEMDGFDNTTNVVVIAATNRPDILDPALLRAGRFDRKVMVNVPTYEERMMIFEYYLTGKKVAKDVKVDTLAKRTSGLVGADIENIVNEAALKVAKEDRSLVEVQDFEYALEKVLMGPEKKIKSIKEGEKKIIAYHELGHAVTAHFLPNTDPVEKISIVSRGHALGVTWMIPKEDKYLHSKAKFLDEIVSLLGGRAAEEVFFGEDEITTGASNDLEKATTIVKDMIVKYGMDKDIGPVYYHDQERDEYHLAKPYSEDLAQLIDQKIKKYLVDAYQQAKKIVKNKKTLIDKMLFVLLQKEYLTNEEFRSIIEDPKKAEEIRKEALQYKEKMLKQEIEMKKAKVKKTKTDNKSTSTKKTVSKSKKKTSKISNVSKKK